MIFDGLLIVGAILMNSGEIAQSCGNVALLVSHPKCFQTPVVTCDGAFEVSGFVINISQPHLCQCNHDVGAAVGNSTELRPKCGTKTNLLQSCFRKHAK